MNKWMRCVSKSVSVPRETPLSNGRIFFRCTQGAKLSQIIVVLIAPALIEPISHTFCLLENLTQTNHTNDYLASLTTVITIKSSIWLQFHWTLCIDLRDDRTPSTKMFYPTGSLFLLSCFMKFNTAQK